MDSSKEFKEAIKVLEKDRNEIQEEYGNYLKLVSEGKKKEAWSSLNELYRRTNESLKRTKELMPILINKLEGDEIKSDTQEVSNFKVEKKRPPKIIVIPHQTKPI